MILCHDLKEILPRAGVLKNVFECLSNYFNRSLMGKHRAVNELRKEQRSSLRRASEAGHPGACSAGWVWAHCRVPASAQEPGGLQVTYREHAVREETERLHMLASTPVERESP